MKTKSTDWTFSNLQCQNCGAELNPNNAVWLDLNIEDGNYYFYALPDDISQGAFVFGKDCAKKIGKWWNKEA